MTENNTKAESGMLWDDLSEDGFDQTAKDALDDLVRSAVQYAAGTVQVTVRDLDGDAVSATGVVVLSTERAVIGWHLDCATSEVAFTKGTMPREVLSVFEHRAEAVRVVRDHPGVEHIWLNAFLCLSPTDEFAAKLGRDVIRAVTSQNSPDLDVLDKRHIVLRINAS